jgi:hypothetical protein
LCVQRNKNFQKTFCNGGMIFTEKPGTHPPALPKSVRVKACNYSLTLWARLTPFSEISQAGAEEQQCRERDAYCRPWKRSRSKSGSEDAGTRVAAIFSILKAAGD